MRRGGSIYPPPPPFPPPPLPRGVICAQGGECAIFECCGGTRLGTEGRSSLSLSLSLSLSAGESASAQSVQRLLGVWLRPLRNQFLSFSCPSAHIVHPFLRAYLSAIMPLSRRCCCLSPALDREAVRERAVRNRIAVCCPSRYLPRLGFSLLLTAACSLQPSFVSVCCPPLSPPPRSPLHSSSLAKGGG